MNTRMNLPAGAVAGLSLLSLIIGSPAHSLTLSLTQDASVLGGSTADQNIANNTFSGGLFSGVDGLYSASNPPDAPARFYLMFTLPKLDPGISVLSATLNGYYNKSYSLGQGLPLDQSAHHLFLADSENWDAHTITWNSQPGLTNNAIGSFIPDSNTGWRSWNITQAVKSRYVLGNTISLGFKADNETITASNNDWVVFISDEYDPSRAFNLDLQLGKPTSPGVPEPSAAALSMGMALCGGILISKRRTFKRN